MDFVHSVKQAIEITKLNGKIAAKVSKDKNATLVGLLIVAIGGFLAVVGRLDTRLSSLVLMPITAIILLFIGVGIMHVFALLFGGKAKYMEYFRAQSYAGILSWLGILALIPFLKDIVYFLVFVWCIVVSVIILESVHKLTRGKAIVVMLTPLIILVIMMIFVIAITA